MTALPLHHINHISRGFLLPRVNRASPAVISSRRTGLAHQFLFHAQQQVCRQALAKLARIVIHPFALSLSGSHRASTKAQKVFHDGGKASHETGQSSQEQSHV